MCTPAWWQASITGRIARTPARWPATRGRWRCLAHRPFPSMMMPICRGRSALSGSGTAAGAGGRCIVGLEVRTTRVPPRFRRGCASNLEKLSLLPLGGVVDPRDELVGDLLHLGQLGRDLVLAHMTILLDSTEVVDLVTADVADGDPRFLGFAMDDLDEFLAALLGQLRDGHADDLPVIARIEAEVALLNRLLDSAQRGAVVRRDDQHAGLRDADPSDALQRCRGPVVVDMQPLEQR